MNGFTKSLLMIFMLVLAALAGMAFGGLYFLVTPASDSRSSFIFEVRPGDSFKSVARRLEQNGLVTSAWKLEMYGRLTRFSTKMRVGEYGLKRNLKPREILSILSSGQSVQYALTITEGMNRFEIADLVHKKGISSRRQFLDLTTDRTLIREMLGQEQASLEGYLFPETYFVTKYTSPRELIKMMVSRFHENFARAQQVWGWTRGGLSDRELVILASIVEKETGAPEERPIIASVFLNRLQKKMPLQTDPTVIYAIYLAHGKWNGAIGRADLRRPSPYNTYLNRGLPPGPIANPGLEALKAVGTPANTPYLFFVSRNDGTHVFSESYNQHSRAVREFQIDRRAREGKSWRDLSKRAEAVVPKAAIPEPAKAVDRQRMDR